MKLEDVRKLSQDAQEAIRLRSIHMVLEKKKHRRKSQDMFLLKPHQCATLAHMIQDKCPDQLKLPFV